MKEPDAEQRRAELFGDLVNALVDIGYGPSRVLYKIDGSGWVWLNRGIRQYTVRYDFRTGILATWRGYFFIKFTRRERPEDLSEPASTARWICELTE